MGKRRMIKPRFWLFMMTILVIVFSCTYISQNQYIQGQTLRIQELRHQKAQIMEDHQVLERKLAFCKTDEYIERMAHERLGLLKKGEIRFVAAGQEQGVRYE